MKKIILPALMCLLLPAFCGCGSNPTVSTTGSGSAITISGRLSTGTISSLGVGTSVASMADYTVVAVEGSTGKTYYGKTDSSGSFSIPAISGASYEVSILDSSSKYLGPVIMSGTSASSEVDMTIAPTASKDMGDIVFDSTKKCAKPGTEPTDIIASAPKARASAGVPLGAGSSGKADSAKVIAGSTMASGCDKDLDGIPDVFDADDDGDGIRTGILTAPRTAKILTSTYIDRVDMSMNIWARHGTSWEAKDQIGLRIIVTPLSGKASSIVSAEVADVPASIKNTAIIWGASSLGTIVGYPAERTLWQTVSYSLYQTTISGTACHAVLIIPKSDLLVGDTFKVRIHFADGSYEDYFKTISYVLNDISRVTTYNGSAVPASSGGSFSTPITFTGPTLAVVWDKPKDETGTTIAGLTHKIAIKCLNTSGDQLSDTEVSVTDTGGNSLSYTFSASQLPSTVGGTTVDTYYVVPIAETADGQRNGEEIWFKKP